MSVDLIPILVDGKVLADEIVRLRKILPPEEFDNPASDIHFHDALIFEDPSSPNNQYAFAKLQPYKNTKYCFDADEIRFQLLRGTRDSNSIEAAKSADTLFRFIGEFIVHLVTNIPFNENGLTGSAIIGPINSSRLHLFFQQINFELLRPFYEEHCKKYDDGSEYDRLKSFEEFVDYVKAFDGLLLQAMEKNKTLYMFAS
jgi:hypothetical protein